MVILSLAIQLTSLLVAGAASSPSAATQNTATICQAIEPHLAQGLSRDRARTLNEEPPGRATLAVLRTEDGCSRPVHIGDSRGRKEQQ